MRSASVTFYSGARCVSESVTVKVANLPLKNTPAEALRRAAAMAEVKAFFGDSEPLKREAAILPLEGPFDGSWEEGRSYKAGSWSDERIVDTRPRLVAILEPDAVTLYPPPLAAKGIEVPEDIEPLDITDRYLVPSNPDAARGWIGDLIKSGRLFAPVNGHVYA